MSGRLGVTAFDAALILQRDVGLTTHFPSEEGYYRLWEPPEWWNPPTAPAAKPGARSRPEPMTAPVGAAAAQAMPGADVALKQASGYVRRVFSSVLKMAEPDVEDHLTFDHFGVDSLISMSILHQFEKDFGQLSSTLLFEHMTVADLAGYFVARHRDQLARIPGHAAPAPQPMAQGDNPPQASATASRAPTPAARAAGARAPAQPLLARSGTSDIAIIGLAGRYPGADGLEQLRENLRQGKNSVGEIPAERWDWRQARDPARPGGGGRWGGFIADIDKFDSLFFNISPREAERMDPQERLFLETVWHAIEHAGYTPQRLTDSQREHGAGIGVFVGCMYQQYHLLAQDAATRTGQSPIASRIFSIFTAPAWRSTPPVRPP